jgi:hypothetical protein
MDVVERANLLTAQKYSKEVKGTFNCYLVDSASILNDH